MALSDLYITCHVYHRMLLNGKEPLAPIIELWFLNCPGLYLAVGICLGRTAVTGIVEVLWYCMECWVVGFSKQLLL